MTNKEYLTCLQAALECTDCDTYTSDMALSTIWGDAPDAPIPPERLEALAGIYTAAHRTIKEISAAAGMSNRKMAERFAIPIRTMENWSTGKCECTLYLRLLMQEVLGLYTPPIR